MMSKEQFIKRIQSLGSPKCGWEHDWFISCDEHASCENALKIMAQIDMLYFMAEEYEKLSTKLPNVQSNSPDKDQQPAQIQEGGK